MKAPPLAACPSRKALGLILQALFAVGLVAHGGGLSYMRQVFQKNKNKMRRVILESPFAGDVERNVRYARACLRDSLLRGEAPIASHLLYTQPGVLNDDIAAERQQGIDAGLIWREVADASVVYKDLGVSKGMQYGIAAAERSGIPVEYRSLPTEVMQALELV